VLRQGPFSTMQACYFKDKANPEASKAVLKFLGSLSTESVVDIQVIKYRHIH
jgi:aspartyl-tRNA synthetase